jgi:hypothetical protein
MSFSIEKLGNSNIFSERSRRSKSKPMNSIMAIGMASMRDTYLKDKPNDVVSFNPKRSNKNPSYKVGSSASSKNMNIMMAAESEPYRIMQNAISELDNFEKEETML